MGELYNPILGPHATLMEAVNAYEASLIEQAFDGTTSITIAARRLGISHQQLDWILSGRHKALAHLRRERRRRSVLKKERE